MGSDMRSVPDPENGREFRICLFTVKVNKHNVLIHVCMQMNLQFYSTCSKYLLSACTIAHILSLQAMTCYSMLYQTVSR